MTDYEIGRLLREQIDAGTRLQESVNTLSSDVRGYTARTLVLEVQVKDHERRIVTLEASDRKQDAMHDTGNHAIAKTQAWIEAHEKAMAVAKAQGHKAGARSMAPKAGGVGVVLTALAAIILRALGWM